MLKPYLFIPLAALALLAAPRRAHAQTAGVGIGTTSPDASAALDIVSTGKGVLLPRVASAVALATPAPGLLVYQTGAPAGFYYNAGTAAAPSWQQLSTVSGAAVTATNGVVKNGSVLGLGGPLTGNTSIGLGSFNLALTGTGRLGIGLAAPGYALDVAGVANAGTGLRVGGNALAYYYGGNLYLGTSNLPATAPSGVQNTFVGTNAGLALTSGINNTVLGLIAGDALTTGSSNTLLGIQAGGSITTGDDNVFIGHDPGLSTVGGSRNVGIGLNALPNATAANDNVAVGNAAGAGLTTGSFNTLLGSGADLSGSTQRSRATALGYNARVDQDDAVVLGDPSNVAVRTGLGTATPAAKLDVQGGAESDGSNDPVALAFSWHDGGFRHFVRSRHNGILNAGGNDLDFFLNNSAAAAGSSAPNTGNVQVLTLESNNGQPRVGVGTATPNSSLQVGGSVAASIRSLGSGTIAATDFTVLVTGNVSLPAPAVGNIGRLYHLINGNANSNTISGTFRAAGTSSGATTSSFLLSNTGAGAKSITVQSDGAQWWIITRE